MNPRLCLGELTWVEPASQSKTCTWSAVNFIKNSWPSWALSLSPWYGHMILVSGYLVLTGVKSSKHWCPVSKISISRFWDQMGSLRVPRFGKYHLPPLFILQLALIYSFFFFLSWDHMWSFHKIQVQNYRWLHSSKMDLWFWQWLWRPFWWTPRLWYVKNYFIFKAPCKRTQQH